MCCCSKRKLKAQAIFLNLFTVCSTCKRKFVVCLFVDEDTYGSYPFANGLNGLNTLNRLNELACVWLYFYRTYFYKAKKSILLTGLTCVLIENYNYAQKQNLELKQIFV
jgi:hypothetical protein